MTKIHQGLLAFSCVEFSAGLHFSVQNVYGYHFYGAQCIYSNFTRMSLRFNCLHLKKMKVKY